MADEKRIEDVVLAIHGGTGGPKASVTAEQDREFREQLKKALVAGHEVLQREGRTSVDAVEAAVRWMEDAPVFNAGRGSVFTREGTIEMDAAIMDGRSREAGAVAGVTTIRNPISGARLVMEKSAHVLLIGSAADRYAASGGLDIVEPSYFRTDQRWNELQELLKRKAASPAEREHGTVGAVALDRTGRLAAATSTGGRTGKMSGRVGDSPLIGSGTYADTTCAVSATGDGEFFIRFTVGAEIAARMKYNDESVAQAAEHVIHGEMKEAGGGGGVIALDARGRLAFAWSSPGLYRGYITRDGKAAVFLYED